MRDGEVGSASLLGDILDDTVGDALELTTSLGAGSSGTPVIDHEGVLVGVVRGAVDDDPRHTVAIPAARLRELVTRLEPE